MRYKRPDMKNALGIIEAAKIRFDYTLTLEANAMSAATILSNVYESFRMLGDALLAYKGIKSEDHVLSIKEISELRIDSKRPIVLVQSLRILRHNINYYGYLPTIEEAKDAISLGQACFYKAYENIRSKLSNLP